MSNWYKQSPPPLYYRDQIEVKTNLHAGLAGLALPRYRYALLERCVHRFPLLGDTIGAHNKNGDVVGLIIPTNIFFGESDSGRLKWFHRNNSQLKDRCFNLGDWVIRNGRIGQVQNIIVKADLHIIGSNIVAMNVPLERLFPVEAFPENTFILYNGWMGKVKRSIRMITIRIGPDNEVDPYVGVIDYRECSNLFQSSYPRKFPVYPFKKLHGPWNSLREATWELVAKGKKGKIETNFEGRVTQVQVDAIDVDWLTNIMDQPEPEARIQAENFTNIKIIDPPDYFGFRIGNIRLFEPCIEDERIYYNHWVDSLDTLSSGNQNLPDLKKYIGKKISVQCLSTQTMVEVLWQEGYSTTLQGIDLEPYNPCCIDFIQGDQVSHPRHVDCIGIVQSVLHEMKNVNVKWFRQNLPETIEPESCECSSDLQIRQGFEYFPGNIIFVKIDQENIISGLIIKCQKDGKIIFQCHDTGEIKELDQRLMIYHFKEDIRHHTPLPILSQVFNDVFDVTSPNIKSTTKTNSNILNLSKPTSESIINRVSYKAISPKQHYFIQEAYTNGYNPSFVFNLGKEIKKLKTGLWENAIVISYDNRMDLFSILLVGTEKTPFEDFIFLFDMILPKRYPVEPPLFHYRDLAGINLLPIVNQKFPFHVHELVGQPWIPENSGLLELLTSLTEHIFVKQPFFTIGKNAKARQEMRGQPSGEALSRRFNERMITTLVIATEKLITSFHTLEEWEPELRFMLARHVPRIIERISTWLTKLKRIEYPLRALTPTFRTEMIVRLPALKFLLYQALQNPPTSCSGEGQLSN